MASVPPDPILGIGDQWTKTGSLIHKPPRGWLHPDQVIQGEGMRYSVRFVGCLEVVASMKNLDFETRSQIAKESIKRVCEAAGLRTAERRRRNANKHVDRMLMTVPVLEHTGEEVTMKINSAGVTLTLLESGELVVKHDMANISFASGGDADTQAFIAYVAKDYHFGRACFVIECDGGLAQDVITTIGQAFELRFKEFLNTASPERQIRSTQNGNSAFESNYYNDLPVKDPSGSLPPVPPSPDYASENGDVPSEGVVLRKETNSSLPAEPTSEPEYVNSSAVCASAKGHSKAESVTSAKTRELPPDPFEMQPLSKNLSKVEPPPPLPHHRKVTPPPASKSFSVPNIAKASKRLDLDRESWFHGTISRKESEHLVVNDGDFLVRESRGSRGQYVLTGMLGNVRKHLLLVDPEGVVRTKDKTFESVSHLINYHLEHKLPIISAESTLFLRKPICRIVHTSDE